MTRVGPRGCPWSGVGGEGLGGPGPVGRWVQSLPTLSFLGRRMTAGGWAIVMGVCSTPAHARDRVVEMSPVPASFAMRRQTHQTERRARPCRVPACQNRRLTSPRRPGQCGLGTGACAQSRTSEPRRNGLLPRGQQPCPAGCGSFNQLDGFYVLLAAADWVRAGAARRDGAVGDRLALGVCLPGLRDHFHEDGLGAVRTSHLC